MCGSRAYADSITYQVSTLFPRRDFIDNNACDSKTYTDAFAYRITTSVPGRDLVDDIVCDSKTDANSITYQFSTFVLGRNTLDNIASNVKASDDAVTNRITAFIPDRDERDKIDVYKFIVWGDVCDNYDHERERYGIFFRLSSGHGERWEGSILAEFISARDSYDALKNADGATYDYSKYVPSYGIH